jgi:hypothetical protein
MTTTMTHLPEFIVNAFSRRRRRDFLHGIARSTEGSA